MNYHVYIVECSDDTFYTGITTDIKRRIEEHNQTNENKKGAKYTKARQPVFLVYSAEFPSRSTASKEEYRIKKLSRKEKEILIKETLGE